MTALRVPVSARSALRLTARAMLEDARILGFRAEHFRYADGAFVCAEGEEEAYELPAGTQAIFAAGESLLAYEAAEGRLRYMDSGAVRPVDAGIFRVASFVDAEGQRQTFSLSPDKLQLFSVDNAMSTAVAKNATDTNLVLCHERLFCAKGSRVRFTPCLDMQSWAITKEQGPGWIDLPSAYGDIGDIAVLRDGIFLFRANGITRLRAYGDTLNFRAEEMPYACGRLVARTVAVCGETALFFTDRGLCAFDGTSARRAECAFDSMLDLTEPLTTGAANGVFYACAALRGGGRALYAYDLAEGCGRILGHAVQHAAFGASVWLMRGGRAYRLTERGLPASGACAVEFSVSLSGCGEGEKRLEAAVPDGEGTFELYVSGEDGACAAVCRAGERAVFSHAVRGETLKVRFTASSQDARLCALTLYIRRDGA